MILQRWTRIDRPSHGEKPWEDSSPQGIKGKHLVGHGIQSL